MRNTITYKGYWDIEGSFNLYSYENIKHIESKEEILSNFIRDYEDKIKEVLEGMGLKYMDMVYYSPHAYNYEGDSIDLSLKVINKKL